MASSSKKLTEAMFDDLNLEEPLIAKENKKLMRDLRKIRTCKEKRTKTIEKKSVKLTEPEKVDRLFPQHYKTIKISPVDRVHTRSMTYNLKTSSRSHDEELKRQKTPLGVMKTIVLFMTTLLISSVQLTTFRLIDMVAYINLPLIQMEIFTHDFVVFLWRVEAVLFFLFIYWGFISLVSKHKSLNRITREDVSDDILLLEILKDVEVDWRNLINWKNLSYSSLHVVTSFCIYYATRFTPFSVCVLINNLGVFFFFQNCDLRKEKKLLGEETNGKQKKIFKFISTTFIVTGLIMLIYSLMTNENTIGYSFFSGIGLSCVSVFLNFFIQNKSIKQKIKSQTPFNMLFTLYANSFIITLFMSIVFQIVSSTVNVWHLFGWLFNLDLFIWVGIGFGLLGLLHIIMTVILSLTFHARNIKMLKYFEIPLNDIFAFYVFTSYPTPITFTYIYGLVQSLLGLYLADYYDYLIK